MKDKTNAGKGLATVGAAIICAMLIHETHGEHGIGWFILSLCFIW
jgi:hypothetical protein